MEEAQEPPQKKATQGKGERVQETTSFHHPLWVMSMSSQAPSMNSFIKYFLSTYNVPSTLLALGHRQLLHSENQYETKRLQMQTEAKTVILDLVTKGWKQRLLGVEGRERNLLGKAKTS